MLDKNTFNDILVVLSKYTEGIETLENSLKVTFDNNFLTNTLDSMLTIVGKSFFTQEEQEDIDNRPTIETVIDMIYHYAFKGNFGENIKELQRLYVEDEGLKTEVAFNAFNNDELYDIIERYLNPPRNCTSYTIHC